MEQHPVPRNITGFQFHLIGDMTFKQFGYLLAGGIVGYAFIAILHSYVGWAIGLSIFATGAAFAFIPIQERPLDKWFVAFIKSIMSPTQFLWKKSTDVPDILIPPAIQKKVVKALPQQHITNAEESKRALDAYLARLPKTAKQTIDTQESKRVSLTLQLFNTTNNPFPSQAKVTIEKPMQPTSSPVPTPQIPPIKQEKQKEEQIASPIRIQTVIRPPEPVKPVGQNDAKVSQAELQIAQLLSERDQLTQELARLKSTLGQPQQQVVRPTNFVEEKKGEETVKIIGSSAAPGMGFPTPTTIPSIISGVIKERNGTTLPNILVTVKDKFQTPVRALKTNAFGQFTTTTPLPNGVYTVELEDPQKKYTFAIIELTLTGDLVTPIEITAKSQKEIVRDKLMKEVFGT